MCSELFLSILSLLRDVVDVAGISGEEEVQRDAKKIPSVIA